MAVDFDFEEAPGEGVGEEPEEEPAPKKRNRLRTILLILLIIVMLCVVCLLASRVLGDRLAGLLPIPIPGGPPTATPAVETPTPAATETSVVVITPVETTGPVPTEASPTPETGELPATTEPTGQPVPPTETPVEGAPTATTVPVPGPTSTPTLGPTVVVTIQPGCDANIPPAADAGGPYTAMMGKGQAVVILDGTGSNDPDGTIVRYEWDFGDGSAPADGETVTYGYTSTGSFVVTLTVTDNCGDSGQDTAEVTIVGPTPPSDNNETPTPSPTSQPDQGPGTMGFCYRVQYGDTLSGIAWYFGVPLRDLAAVNGVSMEYFVLAGQGLFIPVAKIQPGPNVYYVQPGDRLRRIAYHCGLTATTLAQANGLDPSAPLVPGQVLIIPLWGQVYR